MALPANDDSCGTATDCVVKNVGNCCGQYMACVNTAFVPDLQAVKDACREGGMASICGWSEIASCACQAGRCINAAEATEQIPQPMETAIWPASNFDAWPTIRIVALVLDGVLLLLALVIVTVPRCRNRVCNTLASGQRPLGYTILSSIAIGGIGGVWWYFLPCIWWTCDAGPYDGHGVRIGALCVCGSLLGLVACACLLRRPQSPKTSTKGTEDSWEAMDGMEVELNSS